MGVVPATEPLANLLELRPADRLTLAFLILSELQLKLAYRNFGNVTLDIVRHNP
jgi:hypothetical protein